MTWSERISCPMAIRRVLRSASGPSASSAADCPTAKPALAASVVIILSAVSACGDTTEAQELSSLERSGDISFVCRDFTSGEGRPLEACPDASEHDGEDRHLLALVTQTQRGEVAVVDFTEGEVLDTDPTVPGPSFLPVGAQPVDIVSTPGGLASFVGVADAGREGIFALPTACIDAPTSHEPIRDVTSWPACALPAAPRELAIIIGPPAEGGAATACDGSEIPEPEERFCSADLRQEELNAPVGRRKLAVTVPELGALAIIDAQTILNGAPGAFEACVIESWIPLTPGWGTDSIEQALPDAWQQPGVGRPLFADEIGTQCQSESTVQYSDSSAGAIATPVGMVVADEKIYIADSSAPVIHVVDVAEPCSPRELPPLVAVSYEHPARLVTTRDVTATPLTSSGKRFLYAVDDSDGSLITYDIGPDASSRAPLLRPHAPLISSEPPDRLVFPSPIRDLTIVKRDVPEPDPDSGLAILDALCDPTPGVGAPGALYRTADDYTEGARPAKLRGVFVAAVLANGDVTFIDVEDFDAACRRPATAHHGEMLDVFGCSGDDSDVEAFVGSSGLPTVSDELSCNVVAVNELRSGAFFSNDADVGVRAPALRYFPRLSDRDGILQSGEDDEERIRPRMLGVPFAESGSNVTSTLYVGSTLYSTDSTSNDPIKLTPGSASENSVLFPLIEPRAYESSERFSVTYEGPISISSATGRLDRDAGRFTDDSVGFCDMGVQDTDVASSWAAELGVEDVEARASFAREHTDFVQIAAELDDEDEYWSSARGRSCVDGLGYEGCEALFGTWDEPRPQRELAILEAYQDHLVVEPRWPVEGFSSGQVLDELNCCFTSVAEYVVRGAGQWVLRGSRRGLQHRITEGAEKRCVPSCDPARARNSSRMLEISTAAPCATAVDGQCLIGKATEQDRVCVTDADGDQISLANGTLPTSCIHDGPVARFAIFRGREASRRDMSFQWEVTGGFRTLSATMASSYTGISVLPESIAHLESSDRLVVVDGIAGGLSLLSLSSLALSPSKPYQ